MDRSAALLRLIGSRKSLFPWSRKTFLWASLLWLPFFLILLWFSTLHVRADPDTKYPALSPPNSGEASIWQFRAASGSGSGIFALRQSPIDSTWTEDLALGDLDGDGDLDIFLGNRDTASSVWLNDGRGAFTTTGQELNNDYLIDVALGDLDSDGDMDAILAGIQDNRRCLNDGDGQFGSCASIFPGTPTIQKVALGDIDGDSDLDAITATFCQPLDPNQSCTYAVHQIWLNDGLGNFNLSGQSLGHGTALDLALGDLDGDGDLDAMIVHGPFQGSSIWTNLGGGVFTTTQTINDLFATSADFGDLDGDGDLDAFVARKSGTASSIWLNDGSGMLIAGQPLGNFDQAMLGDLDGDGDLDAVSISNGTDRIWQNQGNAAFWPSYQVLGTDFSTSLDLGDLDGDGDMDAVVGKYFVHPRLWINVERRVWLPLSIH